MTQVNKTIELLGGYTSPADFYEAVELQIENRLHEVKADKIYTLEILCGDEFWQILDTAYCRRLAGRCFAHMVDKKRFPFEFIQYKHSPTKRYQLR